MFLSNICPWVSFICFQFLEKENTHLKEELKDILSKLKNQKDQNDSMHEMAALMEKKNEVYLLFDIKFCSFLPPFLSL